MERRVFIAVLLSFVVLYTYQTYFAPPPPETPAAGSKPAPAATVTPGAGAAPSAAAAPDTPPAEPAPVSVLGDSQPREITVETATARVVFSNRGARALRWQLKNYRDTAGEPGRFSCPRICPRASRVRSRSSWTMRRKPHA